jgi:hypothetical protein
MKENPLKIQHSLDSDHVGAELLTIREFCPCRPLFCGAFCKNSLRAQQPTELRDRSGLLTI